MGYFTYIHRLKDLDILLRMEATGTSAQLAKRLGVSRRTIFEYFDVLKSYGAKIKFNRFSKSYYYLSDFKFKI
ncbi:MAG: HTH domain-containing protein [Bacteroidia bacterium]